MKESDLSLYITFLNSLADHYGAKNEIEYNETPSASWSEGRFALHGETYHLHIPYNREEQFVRDAIWTMKEAAMYDS